MEARLLFQVLLTAYIFFVPWLFLSKKFKVVYGFPDRLLGAFLLGVGQIVISSTVLGLFGAFKTGPVVAANLVLTTGLLAVSRPCRADLTGLVIETREGFRLLLRTLRGQKVLTALFLLAAFQVGWWTFLVLLFPPYAWDALTYHMPKVALMLQTGRINAFPTENAFINAYPSNGEILFGWNSLVLRNDLIADGTQILFALAAALALYGIARKVGLSRQNSLVGVTFLLIPIVIQQSAVPYTDVIAAALFLCAVNFALSRGPAWIHPVLLGLAVGLNIGTKYFYLIAAFLPALFYFIPALRRDKPGRTAAVRGIAVFLAAVVLTGGTWYVRNMILYQNPVAPVQVAVGPVRIFPGVYETDALTGGGPRIFNPRAVLRSWLEISAPFWDHPIYNFDSGRGGFGPVFPIVLLPAIGFALVIAVRKRRKDFLRLSAIMALAFLTVPMDWLSRYTLFICGWGILAFAFLLEHLPDARTVARLAAPVFGLTFLLGNVHMYLKPDRILAFLKRPISERRCVDLPVFFEPYLEIFRALDLRPGTTILYTDVPGRMVYPLWNADFSNRVVAFPERTPDPGRCRRELETVRPVQVVTSEGTDIALYAQANPAELVPVAESGPWRVYAYRGGANGR